MGMERVGALDSTQSHPVAGIAAPNDGVDGASSQAYRVSMGKGWQDCTAQNGTPNSGGCLYLPRPHTVQTQAARKTKCVLADSVTSLEGQLHKKRSANSLYSYCCMPPRPFLRHGASQPVWSGVTRGCEACSARGLHGVSGACSVLALSWGRCRKGPGSTGSQDGA